jgi:putative ABC transport system substrate-binding protein
MIKILSPLLILVFLLPVSPLAQERESKKKFFRIGVIQTISHPTFDQVARGFEKALAQAGYREGVQITYDRQNARGEAAQANAIIENFVRARVNLIHSIGSLSSRAAVRRVKHIPIVFSAVPDPMMAGVVPKKSRPETKTGTNVTGVSDPWPVHLQFELYAKFLPRAKRWATLYRAGDSDSISHVREMRKSAKRLGLELIEATLSNSSDAAKAVEFLSGKVHAIHITRDETAASAFPEIVRVCNAKKIPLFGGDGVSASRGAVAVYGLDYFFLGKLAGRRAARILKGQKPGNIPWGNAMRYNLIVNETAAKAQGMVIPPGLLKKADKLVEE